MAEEKKALEAVDLNDLSLQTEELGDDFHPESDAFAFPPPPDDGIHRVRLGYGQDKWKKGVSKADKAYFMAHLQLTPVDEKGWTLFDRPSTMVFGSGTNRVAGIILAVTGRPAQHHDTVGLAKELDALVAGERVAKVETVWEAQCNHSEDGGKYMTVKRGQSKFKLLRKAENGSGNVYDPQIECPKCHAIVGAQARIVRYLNDAGQGQPQAQAATATVSADENPFS